MRSVLLAAIHNGELDNAPAQQVLDLLVDEGLTQGVIEVHEQPALVVQVNQTELQLWRRYQQHLESRWRNHIDQADIGREIAARINLNAYRFRLRGSRQFRNKQWRQRQVEKFVTAKHVHSWKQFLDSTADILIVLESDAAITPDLATTMDSVLSRLTEPIPTYLNLAGGLNTRDLGIKELVNKRAHGITTFTRPVTNTSCAYAINRPLAEQMINFLTASPESGQLGIDWLFNAYFLYATSHDEPIACLHATPPVLLHGSLHGITSSWHPDR